MLLKHFFHKRTGSLIDSIDDIKHENKVFRISRKDFYSSICVSSRKLYINVFFYVLVSKRKMHMTITTKLLLRHEYEFKYHYLEEIILPGN